MNIKPSGSSANSKRVEIPTVAAGLGLRFFSELFVAFEKLRPLLISREFLVGRQNRFRRSHAHAHLQIATAEPFMDSCSGRDVCVITPNRRPDVAAACGADCLSDQSPPSPDPAKAPLPRHALRRPPERSCVAAVMMQVAAHIAAWNPQVTHQRDHDVREILANALTGSQGIFYGRIHRGALLAVGKLFIKIRIQLAKHG